MHRPGTEYGFKNHGATVTELMLCVDQEESMGSRIVPQLVLCIDQEQSMGSRIIVPMLVLHVDQEQVVMFKM